MRSKKYMLLLIALLTFLTASFFYDGTYNNDSQAKRIKTSGAMEAMHFWNQSRAYPNEKMPSRGLTDEYRKVERREKLKKVNDTGNWRELGPHNIGGRTISIALNPLNPNTIYAGSASGGLWRSYSTGEGTDAWEYVYTGFPVLGVSSIAFAPGDSNEIYIGTGEVYNYNNTRGGVAIRETRGSYGIGILKTTDGGQTWIKSLDWQYEQGTGIWSIKINPFNRKTIWAGTTEGTFKSTDAGKSWSKVDSTIMVTDLIIDPLDTNKVFIACGNLESPGHGIYRTEDNGANWEKLIAGLPSTYGGKAMFSQYFADPKIIYLSIGNGFRSDAGTWLCKTTDGGDTWNVQSEFDYSTYQGWFSHFAVVHQENPSTVLTAGVDVYKSTNSGVTQNRKSYWYLWDFGRTPAGGPEGPSDYSHADHHAFVIHPDDPNTVYLANDGGIFRTTDFGETFEGLNGGYQTTQFYNGFATSITDSNFSLGGMQDNSTAIYDGTLEWFRTLGGDGGWTSINQLDNSIAYGSFQRGRLGIIERIGLGEYDNFGLPTPQRSNTAFITPHVISNFNPDILYIGKDIVYKSTNAGVDWNETNSGEPLSKNVPISMAISNTDENLVFVGMAPIASSAEIFRTTNGGDTWENIIGNLPDRYVTDIAVDPNDDNNVFVVFSGFGTSHAFRSADKGDTWINIGDELPDVPTTSIIVDPFKPTHIYVGNDLGVFFSPDNGETWTPHNEGLPDACMVTNLSVSNSNKMLRIATHGNGAFERKLVDIPSSVAAEPANTPRGFVLERNYPNPFNPSTVIEYEISSEVNVTLKIYDLVGREVTTLVNEKKTPGSYTVEFDASGFASGVYVYKLQVNGHSLSRKMILLK